MEIIIVVPPNRARRLRGLRVMARGEWDAFGRAIGGMVIVGGVFLAVSPLLVRMMGPPPLEGVEAVAGGMATVPPTPGCTVTCGTGR